MTLRSPSASQLVLASLATLVSAALGGEAYFRFVHPVEYRRPTTSLDGTLWKSIVHPGPAVGLTIASSSSISTSR